MISDRVRQIRERSVASVNGDGGAIFEHLAEAIDLRLHTFQLGLVCIAVQHGDGRWRIAVGDMRRGGLLFILQFSGNLQAIPE